MTDYTHALIEQLIDHVGSDDLTFDLNGDGNVDGADLTMLVEDYAGTYLGDFDLSGHVDATDLAILKAGFGQPSLGFAAGNANGDTYVDATDLAILKATFGLSAAPTAGTEVPEPATVGLLGLGGLAMFRRRRM